MWWVSDSIQHSNAWTLLKLILLHILEGNDAENQQADIISLHIGLYIWITVVK